MSCQKTLVFEMNESVRSAVTNPQGSKTFLKKILPISVAFILHQRANFDENEFETKTLRGTVYKTFNPKMRNPLLKDIRQWISGAIDALNRNYLRELYLMFCDELDPQIIFESYKFQFKYLGKDVIPLSDPPSKQELMDSTDTLLKAIDSLNQHTQLKTDQFTVRIALTYYDDVTPPSYEPPFFNDKDNSAEEIMRSLSSHSNCYLQLGLLNTGFNIVKCRGKGDVFKLPIDNLDESVATTDITQLDETDASPTKKVKSEAVIDLNETSFDSSINEACISVSDDSDEIDEVELITSKIQCICQTTAEFKDIKMIICFQCGFRQHAFCIGYLSSDDVGDKYVCPLCKFEKALTVNEIRRQQEIGSYRLMIGSAYFYEKFPQAIFDKFPEEIQGGLLQKLKSLGIVTEVDGKYGVNMNRINTYLKGIFAKTFKHKVKLLPDSMNLEDSQGDLDSISLAEHAQKKKKYL